GLDAEREVPWLRAWFPRYQLADGALNCDEEAYTRPVPRGSIVSTLPPLEALLFDARGPLSPAEEAFLDRGAAYLLARRLFRSISKGGAPIDPALLEPCFPRFYHYDVLRGLAFVAAWAERRAKPLPAEAIAEAAAAIARGADAAGRIAARRR